MSYTSAFKVFQLPDFRAFQSGKFFFTFAVQMQAVLVGWQVYSITKDPFSLGLVGLAEAIPFLSSALFAGNIADKYNRKKIVLWSVSIYVCCALLLVIFNWNNFSSIFINYGVWPIYIVIFITGIARGFLSPAMSSLMAQLVSRDLYAQSSTWNSIFWQTAAVCGPAVGGLLFARFASQTAYSVVFVLALFGLLCFMTVSAQKKENEIILNETLKQRLTAGIKFFFSNQIMLSAISLDMFAVLFGGAVALLPAFADNILHVGAEGLGILRAAPAVGSVLMGIYAAYHPPKKNAGLILIGSVACFGLSILLFGLSTNFYLSVFALMISGAFDNMSVIIRHTILQMFTPDHMRGRVNAINFIFVGTSNELGAFESGVAAKIMTLVPSVLFGGSMTLLISGIVFKTGNELRKLHL